MELKKQKYYLEKAQDIGRIGTWELDIEKNILVWTDENYRIFGVPEGIELTYEIFLNCVHPDDREYVDKKWKAALNKEPYDIEHRLWVDGEVKWVREKAEVEFDEKGNCVRGIGFTQDITERKKAEELLQQSTNLLRESQEVARLGHYIFDALTGLWGSSDILDTIFGIGGDYPRGVDGWLQIVHRDQRDEMSTYFSEVVLGQGQPFDREYRITRVSDHQVRWVHGLGRLEFDKEGKPTRMFGTIQDITERKQAEKELKESEERFRSFSNAAFEGIVITKDGKFVDANATFTNLFGYEPEEIAGIEVQMLVAPEDRNMVTENIRSGNEKPYEHKALCKDGSVLDIEVCGRSILYKGQQCRITAIRDITGYKQAHKTLRDNEIRFRQLVENIHEVFWMENADGTELLYVSPAYEEIWGRLCEEFYKNPRVWTDAIHPDDRERVKDAFAKGRLDGTYSEEFRIIRPDGTLRWIWDRNVVIRDESGNTQRIAGIAENITERKRAAEQLLDYQAKLKSLASQLSVTEERERRRIATELHDQIGQSLVFTKIKLDELHNSATSGELTRALDEICNNIGQIIKDTRTLTFDLSSPVLNELGFEAAVTGWLEEQIQEKHGIKTEFEDDEKPKPLDDDIQALLFRNVRELLVNVVKHANAQNVKVSVRKVDEFINISVEDNGKGFDPTEVASKATFGLFSIRERLEQLGGQFEIDSKTGRGSKFTMTAPLKQA
jgi:PAS domain S-box-containing protein